MSDLARTIMGSSMANAMAAAEGRPGTAGQRPASRGMGVVPPPVGGYAPSGSVGGSQASPTRDYSGPTLGTGTPLDGADALPNKGLNDVWLAQSRLRRRRFDACLETCTDHLERNPYDQAVWYLKCRALTLRDWIDDLDMEEEGAADILLDENAVAQVARPGTSFNRPNTSASGASNPALRPMTNSGRPMSGFARPGTSTRPNTSAQGGGRGSTASVENALKGSRPGTSRPVTTSGRFVRLGTASLLQDPNTEFVNVDRLDLRKYAQRPWLARVLCDYIIYHDHNPKKALELCAHATKTANYEDWWWKARLGKCYYQLGLLRDAEKQFASARKNQNMVTLTLELCKIYLRMDQPMTALAHYEEQGKEHPGEVSLMLGSARVQEGLGNSDDAFAIFKDVLRVDASNVEAIACLASHHFYTDQPEIALRYYRRLLQMGVNSSELWNNMGLCCFYSSQYDMCLACFEKALALAEDDNVADIWYNIGQLSIGIGDLGLAFQAFKIAVSIDGQHAEAFCNLGVLEFRKGNDELARTNFITSSDLAEVLHEPAFNAALLAYKAGDFQESYEMVQHALKAFPEHTDSKELLRQLTDHFNSV